MSSSFREDCFQKEELRPRIPPGLGEVVEGTCNVLEEEREGRRRNSGRSRTDLFISPQQREES